MPTNRLIKISPTKQINTYGQDAEFFTKVASALYWISPILNPHLGMYEPPEELRVVGMLAATDPDNWNPFASSSSPYAEWNGAEWIRAFG